MRYLLVMVGVSLGYPGILPAQHKTNVQDIPALVEKYYPRGSFSGIIQLYRGDSLAFEWVEGWADRRKEEAMRQDHLFNVGSLLKPLTSAAVLSLIEREGLLLETPISLWFPDWPQARYISLQHLLSHTSGIPDLFEQPWFRWDLNNQKVLEQAKKTPLLFEPGAAFAYSNTGYIILAEIVAAETQMQFWTYLRQHVLDSLGMKQTLPAYPPPLGIARAYAPRGYIQEVYMQTLGDGGAYASAGDMARWALAYFEGHLLSDSLRQAACKPARLNSGNLAGKTLMDDSNKPLSSFSAYGLGWFIDSGAQGDWVFHYGVSGAYYSEMHYHREEKYLLIILNNTAGRGVSRLARDIREMLTGE